MAGCGGTPTSRDAGAGGGPAGGSSPARPRASCDQSIFQFKKQMQRPVFDRERIVAQRVLDGFYIGSLYHARDLLDRKDYGPAAAVLEICLEVRPNTPGLLFDLARAYAGQKDKKKALSSSRKPSKPASKTPSA